MPSLVPGVFNQNMLDQDNLTCQVLQNCSISDSRHAGLYSICGLAMRLRDLYKWEKRLDPWIERDSAQIIDWIGEKEEEWERLSDQDFHEISLLGKTYEPFDARGINGVLEPHGLLYGAGYVQSLKPTFFLAFLEDKKMIDGHMVYTLGRELARDLFTIPALSQDNSILIRRESGKLFFWDQIFFVKKSGQSALKYALEGYGVKTQDSDSLRRNLERIYAAEMKRYIYHELGEIGDTVFDRQLWREIISAFPHTPIELLTRTVKDLLADTNEYGTLRYMTRERKGASLGFYVAFFDGLAKELFPELKEAFLHFTESGHWKDIEHAVSKGYDTAKHYAEMISGIFREGKQAHDLDWIEKEMGKRLLGPLGLMKKDKEEMLEARS